jgi:hypothetical protein
VNFVQLLHFARKLHVLKYVEISRYGALALVTTYETYPRKHDIGSQFFSSADNTALEYTA